MIDNKNKTVCILGNSLPLLIVPPRVDLSEKTYGEILRDRGYSVINSSKQGVMVHEVYRYFEDEVIRHFPDTVIFHFGVVECTKRARPRSLQRFFSDNSWNNNIINVGYNPPWLRFLKAVLRKIYWPCIEKPLYLLGISWSWLSLKDFTFIHEDLIRKIKTATSSKKIILVGINPVSTALEKRLPGTGASIQKYNQSLRDLSVRISGVVFIDSSHFSQECLSPDGVHLTAKGHAKMADLMDKILGETL